MDKKRIAIIGIGYLGTRHLKTCYDLSDYIEIVSICDINKNNVEPLAKEYQCDFCLDYQEIPLDIDGVIVSVPTEFHYEVAHYFLKKHINVFIEKPITTTLDQANKLVQLAKDNHLKLQVGHIERFNSAFQSVQGAMSNPMFIECHRLNNFPNRSLDIGVVMDLMIHDIDIILGLIPSPIKSIQAVGVSVLTPFEDIANVRLTFENNCICNLTASRISDEVMRKIRIFQESSYISLDYVKQEAFFYKKTTCNISKESFPIEKEDPLKKEVKHFIDCINNDVTPLVSGTEARNALKIALQITNTIISQKNNYPNGNTK